MASGFIIVPSKIFDYLGNTNLWLLLTILSVAQVAIFPETRSRERNRSIVNELVRLHRQYLDGRLPVYDGRKNIYTAGALPFKNKEFVVKIANAARGHQRYDDYIPPFFSSSPYLFMQWYDVVLVLMF
jgi:hypothetical protein